MQLQRLPSWPGPRSRPSPHRQIYVQCNIPTLDSASVKAPTGELTNETAPLQDTTQYVAHKSGSVPANRLRHGADAERSFSSYLVRNVENSHLPNSARTELLHEGKTWRYIAARYCIHFSDCTHSWLEKRNAVWICHCCCLCSPAALTSLAPTAGVRLQAWRPGSCCPRKWRHRVDKWHITPARCSICDSEYTSPKVFFFFF